MYITDLPTYSDTLGTKTNCHCKGPFINDVSRKGEGGISQNLIHKGRLRDSSTKDWSKMLTRGEGVKNPKNSADVVSEQPLS